MFSIENQALKISIHSHGAELQSIFHKELRLEYMWNGDPAFWNKKSPILFPVVGTLKENTYYYENRPYTLGRHGFARDMEFEVENQAPDAITFLLRSNAETRQKFPFEFELRVSYQLWQNSLKTIYSIKNLSDGDMYFSVGGHPAFKVPLTEDTGYTDYYLEFDKNDTVPRWPISKEGLIKNTPLPFFNNTKLLPLSKELFNEDALVFKHLASANVKLGSLKTTHGLRFDFTGFPFLGIWSAKNADFVCIEPWCGIADSVDADQQLVHKEGICRLAAGELFERSWNITLY
jgi:galactose mutarotase-like enzyme